MKKRVVLLFPVWALVATLVAACGNSTGHPAAAPIPSGATLAQGSPAAVPAAGAGNAAGKAAGDPCSMITGAEINQVMGQPFPAPAPKNVGTLDNCQTESAPDSPSDIVVSWAVLQQGDSRATFATVESMYKGARTIAGLGDAAYCYEAYQSSAYLQLLKGSVEVQVGADSCAHAETLAHIAVGRGVTRRLTFSETEALIL